MSALPTQSAVSADPSVRLRGVALGYGAAPVLTVDELDLHAGQVTALIGPNGAGKSTLLSAIAGLRLPETGTLTVLGQAPHEVRRRIALVLQSTAISAHLPVTVAEVVAMGRYPARGMLGRFGAFDRRAIDLALDRLDIGGLRNRQIHELSGGQRQRVFVAQGLAQEADVLLLDEPVSGLDAVSQQRILDVTAAEAEAGRTVVVSTHDLAEAASAHQLVLLAGRVVAAGGPAVVMTDDHLAAAYGARLIRLPSGGTLLDDGSHHGHAH